MSPAIDEPAADAFSPGYFSALRSGIVPMAIGDNFQCWRTRHNSNVWPSPWRATLYPAELRVPTAYAVLTRILRPSEPQRAALASHCSTILFSPHFSHQPA